MGCEEMARSAVEVVAGRLAQRGTDAAGRLTDAALDGVYQLISQRLMGSATGQRVLDVFQRDPGDRQNRAQVAEMVADEANTDQRFADSLGRAATNAGIFVQGAGAVYHNVHESGDQRDITVTGSGNKFTNKKYNIGRIQFGTGGLVTGILTLVVAAGGGTAAVVANQDSVELSSAVGEWTQEPGGQSIPGWTVGPIGLTISADGNFTVSFNSGRAADRLRRRPRVGLLGGLRAGVRGRVSWVVA